MTIYINFIIKWSLNFNNDAFTPFLSSIRVEVMYQYITINSRASLAGDLQLGFLLSILLVEVCKDGLMISEF